MADRDQIIIELKAKVAKFESDMKKANRQIEKTGDKAKKSAKQVGRMRVQTEGLRRTMGALRNNILLVTFAFGGTFAALKKLTDLYAVQELAEAKLANQMGGTSEELLNYASALQKQSRFGDEAIIVVQALIAAFTKDEEQIKGLTKATLDLAAEKGMDLAAAADLVGKSFGSSTNALSRYAIEVEGAAASSDRFASITQSIADKYAGAATAEVNTLTGAMDQLSNTAGDLGEILGKKLAPELVVIAKTLENSLTWWEQTTPKIKKFRDESSLLGIAWKALTLQVNLHPLTFLKKMMDDNAEATDGFGERVKGLTGKALTLTQKLILNEEALKTEIDLNGVASEQAKRHADEIERLTKALQALKDEQEAGDDGTAEIGGGAAKTVFQVFLQEQQQRLEGIKREERLILRLQDPKTGYPQLVKDLDLYTDSQKEARKEEDKRKDSIEKMHETSISSMMELGAAYSQGGKEAKRAGREAVMASIRAAVAQVIAKEIATKPFPASLAYAATAGFAVDQLFGNLLGGITAAQYGMNEVVDKPTLILAGEAGAEHVGITPLESPNTDGTQGGGASVVVNVSGNVLTSDFVEGELAENIREAVRRGTDFGIG